MARALQARRSGPPATAERLSGFTLVEVLVGLAIMATLAAIAETTAKAQPNGQFTAAQYRDATGIGRSLAIEILEALDRIGVTQRLGDARKARKPYEPLLGPAGPIPKPTPAAPKPAARPQPPRGRTHYR